MSPCPRIGDTSPPCGRVPDLFRTPKEQHLPVNLSGIEDRAGTDVSGKRWEHPPAHGERAGSLRYRISQALAPASSRQRGRTRTVRPPARMRTSDLRESR
ncbi:hypothetical protein GCM10022140_09790 [Rhodococcus aetherivorans]